MSHDDETVTLGLSRNEALVLFEFLTRYSNQGELRIADQAEQRVLWDLCALLEKQFTEPLSSEYAALLARAREAVRDKS